MFKSQAHASAPTQDLVPTSTLKHVSLHQPTTSRKRTYRQSSTSSNSFSIEELSPEDMGYDGDIEVLRPSTYEEPASDSSTSDGELPDSEDELANKLRRLLTHASSSSSTKPNWKRRPRSLHVDYGKKSSGKRMSSDIEISELNDNQQPQPNQGQAPPTKRRRKRDPRPYAPPIDRLRKESKPDLWTDSSDRNGTQERQTPFSLASSTSTIMSAATPAAISPDNDTMDLT